MALDPKQIHDIAELVRLQVEDEQIEEYQQNISNILEMVNQLTNFNTEGVKPLANPLEIVQRLRADVVTTVNQREHFQSIAPQTEQGYYLVPRVVE